MERIGKYIVHKRAVTSGPARILFCHDPDLEVPVAVKLFDPRAVSGTPLAPAQMLSRFLAEARLLASFDHPYIIAVKTLERLADGRPYFVMPYQAAHLAFEIGKDSPDPAAPPEDSRPRRMPPARALTVLRQVGAALLALHRRAMVHRAVQPSNILLTAHRGGSVKLCDFSMVKTSGNDLPLPERATVSPYTAPELIENAAAATPSADIHGMGMLAFRLLTGRLPTAGDRPAELLPAPWAKLIEDCLAPDPAARPAHAGEMLRRLDLLPPPPPAPPPQVERADPRRAPPRAVVPGPS